MINSFKDYLHPGTQSETLVTGLLVTSVALLPFSRLIEIPMLILSGLGFYLIIKQRRICSEAPLYFYNLAFLSFIVPMLLALPDAANLSKSAITTIGSLRYYFAGLAILVLGGNAPRRLGLGVTVILCFWGLDAFLQLTTGTNILGYELEPGYTNSVFGEGERLKLGFAIVIFLPVVVMWATERLPWPAVTLITAFLFCVVLISGKRSAWLMAVMEILLLLGYFWATRRIRARALSIAALVLIIGASITLTMNDRIRLRGGVVIESLENMTYQTANIALSKRLTIWETALEIGKDRWINGVGTRGFRYVYADYAEQDDPFDAPMENNRGAGVHHSHQVILEISCETASIGLAGSLLP